MSTTILHLDSSPMGDASVSRKFSRKVVSGLVQKYPDHHLITHDLAQNPVPHLSPANLAAFFVPEDQRTPDQAAAAKLSDQLVDELLRADIIVIGAPMWNLAIPSTLKAWIDHIVRVGKTFKYTETGAKGLLPNTKKVIIVSSRGGVYTQGPAQSFDFQETYLKGIFQFLGVTDISFVRAEGTSMGEESLQKAHADADSHVEQVLQLA